jgi:carbon-monoxide dehydrogenase medium subunit
MREFDFAEPRSVAEASQMLAEYGDDARIIAGGSALMLAMRQRMLAPTHLISVASCPGCMASISIRAKVCVSGP